MATERIEETILRNLIYDEEFYRKVVPFLKADYFIELQERVIFEEINDFSTKYDKNPTKEVLNINLQNRSDLTDETFQQSAQIPAFAVAIYDTTIGAEASEDYDLMNKGREWFQKNFIDAYYTLLD